MRALSHITGGGFYENIPARYPRRALCARFEKRRAQDAADLRHHRPRGRHPRARHVQHLQYGRRHVRRRVRKTARTRRSRRLLKTAPLTHMSAARSAAGDRRGGRAMLKTAVLVSGGGTNLQALHRRLGARRDAACGARACRFEQAQTPMRSSSGEKGAVSAREYVEKAGFEERLNALLDEERRGPDNTRGLFEDTQRGLHAPLGRT